MLKDRIIKSYVLLLVCLTGMQSCQINKNLSSASKLLADRSIAIPTATARVFKDASGKIYSIDLLRDKTPVTMTMVNLRFYNNIDTLRFNFENVKFHFSGDTIQYDNFVFPQWDISKYTDTMQCTVSCFYSTPAHPTVRCIKASYITVRGEVINIEPYNFCN